jgi:hypothetical protein
VGCRPVADPCEFGNCPNAAEQAFDPGVLMKERDCNHQGCKALYRPTGTSGRCPILAKFRAVPCSYRWHLIYFGIGRSGSSLAWRYRSGILVARAGAVSACRKKRYENNPGQEPVKGLLGHGTCHFSKAPATAGLGVIDFNLSSPTSTFCHRALSFFVSMGILRSL